MKLRNPFPERVRNLWLDHYGCIQCERSDRGLELHHIYGRVSSSAFNSAPVCMSCHSHMGHSQEEQRRLLLATTKYLISTLGYQPTDEDMLFLTEHERDFKWVQQQLLS